MKELQKEFKKLLSLETMARDLYSDILRQSIGDRETVNKINSIKNQEAGHILMAKELIKISSQAELRKDKPYFSGKALKSLVGDKIIKRNLLFNIVKLLDAKVRTFTLLGLVGREAFKFKKADKERQEFTKMITHQLRTPLTASNWISELFLKKNREKMTKDERKMIEQIRANNKIIFSFVDDLLEAGRIEEMPKLEKTEKVDLVKIFKEAIKDLAPLIKNKKQKISISSLKDEIIILSDEKSLKNIISNLISNAINYGKNKGKILIKIKTGGINKILFSVADNGIGIPKKERKNIFKKFFRAPNARNFYEAGTGFGLYVVKELTKKLGGKVWFESEENKGTTFYVSFPTR